MKFTLNWLKQYIDFDLTPSQLADRLTMAGLEVDSVEDLYPNLDGVKVGLIKNVQPHPNADRLVLCDVEVGEEIKRVVCGAPNARVGLVTAIALPGTVMPADFKIKSSKIRGEKSEGMLCSAKELGISGGTAGIMELPVDLVSGKSLSEALSLHDTLIEVDLTPNRSDCASVLGIAREVGGFVGRKMSPPVKGDLPVLNGDLPFSVEVIDQDACPRYAARLLQDVKIAPSPWWLQRLLLAVGLRPINNVVDITNFVMLEYGQPMHAFDFAKIKGAKIIVRKAVAGEKIVTLDGVERQLDTETLLICDAKQPIAVAGVMGGGSSEVTETTTDILLESACFNPLSVRRTSKFLNLSTDSSYRFERGVDPDGVVTAMERAVQLMVEIAGARVVAGGVDWGRGVSGPASISLRVDRCSDLLGMKFTADDLAALLALIEIGSQKVDDHTLSVMPPSFRVDLEREIDLIEEIARLHGYNELPSVLPVVQMSFPERESGRDLGRQVSAIMVSQGFFEAINYSFVSERHFEMLGLATEHKLRQAVGLLNPLTEDQSIMRTMLLPGLLENVRHNVNHQKGDIKMFETGKVFYPGEQEQPHEERRLVVVISGRRSPGAPVLHYGQDKVDLYDLKGCVENLLTELRLPQVSMVKDAVAPKYIDAEQFLSVQVDGREIGYLGKLAQVNLKSFGIKQDVYFCEISLDDLGVLTVAPKVFQPLARFPSVRWDMAILVLENTASGEMVIAIRDCGEEIVEQAEIFDIYRGKNIDSGYKSIAISVTYRDYNNTLDDDTVGKVHQKIIDMILSRFNGQLREA
ncbi:MAG: phenylalanine--tRNA ligase subunit beta [Proteobacteria bacterium]|nr:phenylalanine--tRNA ligase subunit beta [Pseudomonadota bacterium]MBU1716757.1 phenylalanine--tRNA ligase subunit beta [Pseudomonadota bacterium]